MGIYGVIFYSIARRTHEIGVRMALGARQSDVLHSVLTDGLRIAACGMAFGLPGALLLTRLLTIWRNLASYLPARRAAQVDPMAALRPGI